MKKRFKKVYKVIIAIIITIFLLLFIAFCDLQPYPRAFWIFSVGLVTITAIFYSILTKKILDGCLILFAWLILLAAGLEDFFFYTISGQAFPKSMFHLYDEPWMGFIARFFGFETVTPLSLIISIILGIVVIAIVMFLFKFLRNKKWWPKWL